jgi:hypothetical protein
MRVASGLTALLVAVPVVILNGAEKQVGRINTQSVVAFVQDALSAVYIADEQQPRDPVGTCHFAVKRKLSVPIFADTRIPVQTAARHHKCFV